MWREWRNWRRVETLSGRVGDGADSYQSRDLPEVCRPPQLGGQPAPGVARAAQPARRSAAAVHAVPIPGPQSTSLCAAALSYVGGACSRSHLQLSYRPAGPNAAFVILLCGFAV